MISITSLDRSKFLLLITLIYNLNEAISCFKATDGMWGQWSKFSDCSTTCGQGTKVRQRQCNDPEPILFGKLCPGNDTQTRICNVGMTTKADQISSNDTICLNQDEINSQPTPAYTKVFVALGVGDGALVDVEIVDLLSSETSCQKPQNFPYKNFVASGGLGFHEKPLICGGGYNNRNICHIYEDGAWKSSDSLIQGRYSFAMTKSPFQDGSKLFVSGGFDDESYLSSGEILTENGWEATVPLPVSASSHCMVSINETSVMIIGGWQNGISGKSFLFNHETNLWTEGPTLRKPRVWHSCGSIRKNSQTQEKSIIVVGGFDQSTPYLTSVEVLDLDSNTWRRGTDLPFGIGHAAMVEDPSGGVVLIGGEAFHMGELNTLYTLPHAGSDATWVLMQQQLKTSRYRHTAFLVPDELARCN